MALSDSARKRIEVATTHRVIGKEISDAIDAGTVGATAANLSAVAAAASAVSTAADVITTAASQLAAANSAIAAAASAVSAAATVPVKRTVTVTTANFSALTTENVLSIDIGAVLPANARIVGHEFTSLTPFDDGGANVAVSVELGIKSGDVDAIVTSYDVSSTGVAGPGTSGVLGYPMAKPGTVTLAAKFTTTNAAHLKGLDAGSVVINVFYVVLA